MLVTEQERMRDQINAWTEKFGTDRSAMLPILQNLQATYGYCSDLGMQVVADVLGIHPVEVHGVVSFYEFLTTKPQGRFVIRLCRTITCDLAGKDAIAQQLRNDLGIDFGQTTEDGMFTLTWANCIGMCDQGPAMLVNETVYTHVQPEQIQDIIETCRQVLSPNRPMQHEEH